MKRILLMITVTVLFLTTLKTGAQAGNPGVHGVVIGGGTGAVVGHAIGRNPEAAIIGATVGSMVGLIIGIEIDRNRRVAPPPVRRVVAPPPARRVYGFPPPEPQPRYHNVYAKGYYYGDFVCPACRKHITSGRSYHARKHHIPGYGIDRRH